MNKLFLSLAVISLIGAGCIKQTAEPQAQPSTKNTGIANPASVNCIDKGGRLEIRADAASGGEVGYCIFSDGSECEEWVYFRGECQKGGPTREELERRVRVRAEGGYRIEKALELGCATDTECVTPGGYLMMSRCPFTSLCLEKKCKVVCPSGF